jgi:hypothetical protein
MTAMATLFVLDWQRSNKKARAVDEAS